MSSPNSPPPATAPPPSSTNSTSPPPPPQSSDAPPPQSSSPPPPSSDSPPPLNSPPPVASPPPQTPPPVISSPPPPVESSPAPPVESPPPLTTPPPLPTPSPPPPSLNPPQSSPAPPSKPPENSPPPPAPSPPKSNPVNSPPPPSPPSSTPEKSPPSPSPPSITPSKSPPSPPSITPSKSPPSPSPLSITPSKSPPSPPTPPSSSSPPPKKSPLPTPSPPPPPPQSPSQPVSSPPSLPSPPSTSTPDSASTDPPTSSSIPSPPIASNSQGIGTTGAVAISVVAGFILLGFIALAIWYLCIRKRRHRSGLNGGHIMPSTVGSSLDSDSSFTKAHSSAPILGTGSSSSDFVNSPPEPNGLGNSRPLFTHNDLVKATNRFSPQNLLGEGGFGLVYKGHLPDGRVVAVKQLKIGGGQGEREFKAEVETISRIHHRHLVSLVGYCISENQRLLVYEYVPNNTLYFHLHGKDRPVLDWARRVKIAVGAARGIAYLHEDCHPRIIHRDIKSSNILLDDNFDARVSDFGLAKIALDMYTHITTRVMGTFGYMAPEYASSGKLTDKSDVFSFGVVLLELVTGRKPVDTSQPLGDESLVEWARPLLSHALETENFEGLADPRLEGNYVESEMFRMIEAAAACVRHSAAKRPRMGQVARAFDSVAGSDLTNGMRPGQSEVFNSAQQSEEIRFFRRMAFGSQKYSTDFFSTNV